MKQTKTPKHSLACRLSFAFSKKPRNHEQLLMLLRDAEHHNVINSDALSMIEGVIQISDMQVRDIMIPRTEMTTVKEDQALTDLLPIVKNSGHSRIPVEGKDQEEIIGILMAKDLLNAKAEGFEIHDSMRPAVFVPESKRLNALLKEFRNLHNHIAIVVDEYGGVSGLVTIEDILEQIVGDIEDEHDLEEEKFIKRHNEKEFTIKAHMPIEEFNEYFKTDYQDDEFDTVAGMVNKAFGYLPKRNESTVIDRFKFTVLRADKRRVHLLRLRIED